uniref:Uncharacterized protein n=1 Tax=Medicago truncatula TaxID=3880 RepID=A2Q237_MEDTR|nr:hypothetical protein MtrDRAFT_AC149207g18v2 [Medicago truncatula]
MDNDNDFYIVKFDQDSDKENVIFDKPWMIYAHANNPSGWISWYPFVWMVLF